MYNTTVPYLRNSLQKDYVPKTPLLLSKNNQLSLPLCEILVSNAPDTDSIFYAIMDVKEVRRIVKSSSNYNQILNSGDNVQKKELFEKLLKKETAAIFKIESCNEEVIDILTKDICS